MLYLANKFGGFYIKYLFSKETKCNYKFGDSLDKNNLIQIFGHIYSRHPHGINILPPQQQPFVVVVGPNPADVHEKQADIGQAPVGTLSSYETIPNDDSIGNDICKYKNSKTFRLRRKNASSEKEIFIL
jgi:hypothetical protein